MTELEKSLQDVIDAQIAPISPSRGGKYEMDYWYRKGVLRGLTMAMSLIQGISGDSEDGQ